ncbi:MAG: hypothetical protein WB689_29840 [Xanthobacteraceae bacterium]
MGTQRDDRWDVRCVGVAGIEPGFSRPTRLLQRNDCRKLMRRVMSILELPVRTYIEPMRDTGAGIRTKNLKLPLPNAIKKKKIGILSTSVAVGE